MIKKLILCRHAEALAGIGYLNDLSRQLTDHGKNQARQVGEWMLAQEIAPDLIHTSKASRAIQTAELIAARLNQKKVMPFMELYNAPATVLLRHVNQLPSAAETVVLVGHNPGISDLATALTGRNFNLGTAELVTLQLPVSNWAEVSAGIGL